MPGALVPCEMADVRLTVRGLGGSPVLYDLRDLLPAGVVLVGGDLPDDRALTWSGAVDGAGTVVHAYRLQMGPGDAEALALTAGLTWDGEALAAADVIERVLLDVELELVRADRTLYADDAFAIEAVVRNPLDRPLRVWLAPTASSRVALLEGPTEVDLPAGGEARVRYAFAGREAGAAAFQVVPYACDPGAGDVAPAGPAASLRLTLAPVPDLPPATVSTEVTVDLAARRLPVLDGLVLVSRLPDGASYRAGSSFVDGEPVADPREVDGSLVFELGGRTVGQVRYTVEHDGTLRHVGRRPHGGRADPGARGAGRRSGRARAAAQRAAPRRAGAARARAGRRGDPGARGRRRAACGLVDAGHRGRRPGGTTCGSS